VWDRLVELYAQLRPRLTMKSFIWCYCQYTHWVASEVRRLWVLDVPDDRVQLIDGVAWDILLREKFAEMTQEEAWARLLTPRPSQDDVWALIEAPVPKDWVADSTKYNMGCRFRNASYEELPVSIEVAQSCRRR
jgi:hypothetical protein